MLSIRIKSIINNLNECGFVRSNVQIYLSTSGDGDRVCTFLTLHKKNKVYRLTMFEQFSIINVNIDESEFITSTDGADGYEAIHEQDLSDYIVDFMYSIGVLKNTNGK